ncbi:hypothetical protein DV738_g5418, partial [Chaetothyriales sp. CBS 135597]
MWILESAGDFLNGKRLWLKPGKKYLFGRVKRDGVRFAIEHKTVSRRHLVIEVGEVQDGEVAQLHARTKVRIIDQNSKSGTTVNGHILKGSDLPSRELDKAENSVRPGNSEELIIRWQPYVVTFNLQKKELKTGVLKQKQDRLKSFGIKAIAEFTDLTTHLVVAKRNTPKGLQALITGKHLVTESFIDAIEYAATPSDIDADEDASPLELDFDSHWPNAEDYLPPPGREPTERPVEAYQPGPDRSHVFENYTFVFGDKNQFDNLLPVITTGHGKALHFSVDPGHTTVEELTTFVRNAGGAKDDQAPLEKGGVLLVQWEPKGSEKDSTTRLIDQVALNMAQRPVEQAEFLDAILANDASVLKQPIPHPSTVNIEDVPAQPAQSARPAPPTQPVLAQTNHHVNGVGHAAKEQSTDQEQPSHAQEPVKAQPPPNRIDRFKLPPPPKKIEIDDDFNPDDIAEYESEEEEVAVKAEEEIKPEEQSNRRKRRRTPSPSPSANSFEEQMDDLAPAATAMKRRKLELEAEARRKGLPLPIIADKSTPAPKAKKRKVEKEIDIQEVIRGKREQEREDEERRKERLENLPPIDETDKGPANLVVVETLDIPIRKHSAISRANPEDDPRWDKKWNGRKNFKRFRPQSAAGAAASSAPGRSKAFVPLVEFKRKDDGTGDRPKGRSDKQSKRQKTLPVVAVHGSESDDSDDLKFQFSRATKGKI